MYLTVGLFLLEYLSLSRTVNLDVNFLCTSTSERLDIDVSDRQETIVLKDDIQINIWLCKATLTFRSAVQVGFNIVWSVLYGHREYNTLQTILKLAYITTTHFQAASELAAA